MVRFAVRMPGTGMHVVARLTASATVRREGAAGCHGSWCFSTREPFFLSLSRSLVVGNAPSGTAAAWRCESSIQIAVCAHGISAEGEFHSFLLPRCTIASFPFPSSLAPGFCGGKVGARMACLWGLGSFPEGVPEEKNLARLVKLKESLVSTVARVPCTEYACGCPCENHAATLAWGE